MKSLPLVAVLTNPEQVEFSTEINSALVQICRHICIIPYLFFLINFYA